MLDYTKAAFQQIAERFKRLDFYRSVITQSIYITYLAYALIADVGNVIANAILLPLAAAYLLFYVIAYLRTAKRTIRKRVKRIFRRSKQIVKILSLGILAYGIVVTAYELRPLSLFFTTLMAVGLLVQILFEFLFHLIKRKAKRFVKTLEADFAPLSSITRLFHKNTQENVPEEAFEDDEDTIWNI